MLYRPFQSVAPRFPQLSRKTFEEAVQLVWPNGTIESGADAVFHTLETASSQQQRIRSLRRLPGFMPLARWAYGFISRHRTLVWNFYRVCRKGRDLAISTTRAEK